MTEHHKKPVTFVLCRFPFEAGLPVHASCPRADHSLFAALNPPVSVLPAVPLLRAFRVQLFIAELVGPRSLFGR